MTPSQIGPLALTPTKFEGACRRKDTSSRRFKSSTIHIEGNPYKNKYLPWIGVEYLPYLDLYIDTIYYHILQWILNESYHVLL